MGDTPNGNDQDSNKDESNKKVEVKSMGFTKSINTDISKTEVEETPGQNESTVSSLNIAKKSSSESVIANIVNLATSIIRYSREHKYPLYEGEELEAFTKDIKVNGIISPLHVKKIEDEEYEYEVIIGNNRLNVASLIDKEYVPCIIEDVSDARAHSMHHSSNLYQRGIESLSYAARIAIMNQCYGETKFNVELTEDEIDKMSKIIDKSYGETTIKKYLKMYSLIDELVEELDKDKIGFNVAYFLSILREKDQNIVLKLLKEGIKIDIKTAKILRDKKNSLDQELIERIMSGPKKEVKEKAIIIKPKVIEKYFSNIEKKEIPNIIEKALELYFEKGES